MSRSIVVTSDPRPIPAHRERRVYEVRIIAEKGNPNIIVEGRMERWYLDAGGSTLGEPDRDNDPLVRRILTPEFLAANPAAVQILTDISNAIDAWDVEDGNAV